MAASESDFTDLAETGKDVAAQWPQLVRILMDMRSLWRSRTEVSDQVQSIDLLYGGVYKLRFEANSGGGVIRWHNGAAWVTIITLTGTGITFANGLTVGDDIDLAGNALVNVSDIDGWTPAAHWAQHAFGGGDAPSPGTPSDVGTANAAGSSATFVRGDHVHAGAAGFKVDGSALQRGELEFITGSGMSLVKAGNQVTVSRDNRPVYQEDNLGGGDQSIVVTTKTDITGLTQIDFPEVPNATKKWTMWGSILLHVDNNNDVMYPMIQLHVGSTGDKGDSIIQTWANALYANGTSYEGLISVPVGPITLIPGTGNISWGLSIEINAKVGSPSAPAANTVIKGSSGAYSYMELIPRYHE
jgi:hypothetical protein